LYGFALEGSGVVKNLEKLCANFVNAPLDNLVQLAITEDLLHQSRFHQKFHHQIFNLILTINFHYQGPFENKQDVI
jgi:hypothetical protein